MILAKAPAQKLKMAQKKLEKGMRVSKKARKPWADQTITALLPEEKACWS